MVAEMVESNVGALLGAMWALTSLSLCFIIARCILKYRHGKTFAADDWTLWLAWCLLLSYTSLTTKATTYGLGHHLADISQENIPSANKYLTVGEFFAVLALQTSKTSFAITLLRLVTQTSLRRVLWVLIITLNIVMGLDAIFTLVSCVPTAKIWSPDVRGKCWKPDVIVNASIFAGVYSGIVDLVLAGFPFLILKPLNMEKREKWGICFAMSLGFFAGITAFIKSSYMPQLGRWQDVTFSSYIILIWACAEASICMIATCIPYFRLVLSHPGSAHRSRGYEMQDEELQLGLVTPGPGDVKIWNPDWTGSTQSEGKRVSLPAKVRRGSEKRAGNHAQSPSVGSEAWKSLGNGDLGDKK